MHSLGLTQETVKVVHLVNSSFRPAFLCYCIFDLLTEGFEVLGVLEKTVQYLRGCLRRV
jgi:hypothetical protein